MKKPKSTVKNVTKEFSKEILQNMVWDECEEGFEVIKNEIVDNSRWSIQHDMVFKDPEGLHYETYYSVGATEIQDESPYEYDPDMVECYLVEAKTVEVTQWVNVKEQSES